MSLSESSIISQQNLTARNFENTCSYEFEDFRLDSAHLMLYRNEKTISLKPKVVETLVALVERRGEVIGKDELMNRLWADSFVEESNLTQNIYLLRKTLGDCADGRPFIENFSRRGYRFNGEIKTQNDAELLIATHTKTQTVIEEETIENRTRRNWLIPVLALVVAFGAIAFAVKQFVPNQNSPGIKNSAASPFETFKIKRHSESGDITAVKVSPDGKFIAYNDKKGAFWLKNTATDSNIKILPESKTVWHAVVAISPDNNYVYLHRAEGKKNEILKMSLFGGGVAQKIGEEPWSDWILSPDGKQFSFVRDDGEPGKLALFVANSDGTGTRKVAVSKEGEWFGLWSQSTAWSPDGRLIACTGGTTLDGKSLWDIKIFRVADGEEISIIKPEVGWSYIDSVAWLPDGENLLVIGGDQSSNGQIYKYTISTGEWRRITNDLNNYVQLAIPADGKTIITTQEENPGNLWILPASGDKSQAKQITFGRNLMTDASGVSWTPDGKIVYATNAGGKWEIWKINADGSNQKQLTQNCSGNDSCGKPVVSLDGTYIVFHATRDGATNIWRIDADGANPTQLTFNGGLSPALSPEGRLVIYSRWTTHALALWQVSIDGGESRQFSPISTAANAGFSPDGKQIAFSYYDETTKQQTCVAPIGAESPEQCYSASRSFPHWAEDSKAFYYLNHAYLGIWKQPLDGASELFLEFPGERTNSFAFSPDGKQLVVARSKPTQDIVVLTEKN
jgi:Tol biopolymer transport system component/DNA-binding winged helix-turn-helix (wHTH) protein